MFRPHWHCHCPAVPPTLGPRPASHAQHTQHTRRACHAPHQDCLDRARPRRPHIHSHLVGLNLHRGCSKGRLAVRPTAGVPRALALAADACCGSAAAAGAPPLHQPAWQPPVHAACPKATRPHPPHLQNGLVFVHVVPCLLQHSRHGAVGDALPQRRDLDLQAAQQAARRVQARGSPGDAGGGGGRRGSAQRRGHRSAAGRHQLP